MKIATFNVNGVNGRLPRPGDFNVVPTNADIYNAWLWRFDAVLQPETRAAHERLLAQGWVDATRQLYPDERIYTFWVNPDAFRRNAGFRMDFLLLSPALATQLAATGVDSEHRGREKPSDHAPVWIELAPAPGKGNATAALASTASRS